MAIGQVNALECVVNISEGEDNAILARLARVVQHSLLDIHSDRHHNRSVFTLLGPNLEHDLRSLASEAAATLDIRSHHGVHPRIGIVDVVPFCPLGSVTMDEALTARNRFALWLWDELEIPGFLYGPERSLPEIRRDAFITMKPQVGYGTGNLSAGAAAVGVREVLIAYNLTLEANLEQVRDITRRIRSKSVRALAFRVADEVQLSLNLITPQIFGPWEAYAFASEFTQVKSAELVGLLPRSVLEKIEKSKWTTLGLSDATTIESRVEQKPWYSQ